MKFLTTLIILFFCWQTIRCQTATTRDKKFVECMSHINSMEIKLGQLAQTNASSEEVKKLGQLMIDDHTKAAQDLKTLADRENIPVASALNKKQQKYYDKLAKKTGKDFDKAYIKCVMKTHKKELCKLKKQAKRGNNIDLKAWAGNTKTTSKYHKKTAGEACKNLKS